MFGLSRNSQHKIKLAMLKLQAVKLIKDEIEGHVTMVTLDSVRVGSGKH